jgi:hypothetical protein
MATADVEIRLRLQDSASKGLATAAQSAQKASERTATATERAASRAAAATARGNAQQLNQYNRLARAREQLGIRSERSIQREIDRTRGAYERLARSGTMTWREQARAANQMRQRVTQLTNEMGRLTARQRAMNALNTARNVTAGTAAAAYVAGEPIRKGMAWERRLAYMANTAYEERDTKGRRAGMEELSAAVQRATEAGGGSRDDAGQALDTLIASGAMKNESAMNILPQIMKAATASGASADEMANIAIRSMQGFDISESELPNIFNMAIAAGKAGGFELRDMSRWLPQQMAAAKMSGMSGREDFAALAALNQAASITAGTKDEAGNNVANLLRKINSRDTSLDAKRFGIDLSKQLATARAKGVNSLDAFGGIVHQIMAKDPAYRKLQKQLSSAGSDEERKKTLESMSQIAQGSAVGKLIQDQQALMALMAFLNNQDYMQDVRQNVRAADVESGGPVDRDMELIRTTSWYSQERNENARAAGEQALYDSASPAIKGFYDAMADARQRFPMLTSALELAAQAAVAFAAAAGLSSMLGGGGFKGARRMLRRAGGGSGRTSISPVGGFGPTGGAAVGGIAAGARGLTLARAGAGLAKGGLLGLGSVAGGYALDKIFGEDSAVSRYGSAALTYGSTGAMIGSIIPGLGTAVGAAIGGAIGLLSEGISDWLGDDEETIKTVRLEKNDAQPVDLTARIQLGLPPGFVVQAQSMQASGGNVALNVGNINTGAPG